MEKQYELKVEEGALFRAVRSELYTSISYIELGGFVGGNIGKTKGQ